MGDVDIARGIGGGAIAEPKLRPGTAICRTNLGGEAQQVQVVGESKVIIREELKGREFMPHWDPCPQPHRSAEAQARELVDSVLNAEGRSEQMTAFARFTEKVHSPYTSTEVLRATRDLLIQRMGDESDGQRRQIMAAMLHVVDHELEQRGQVRPDFPWPPGPGPDPVPWPPHPLPLELKKWGDIF